MGKQRILFFFIALACVLAAVVWFAANRPNVWSIGQTDSRLQVATSFYPLYFFASQIGGEYTRVVNITPSGNEPHDYEPTPQDMVVIANSDVLVLNGGGLEAWADKVRGIINPERTRVIEVSNGILSNALPGDYHVWLSPVLAQTMVETITNTFVTVDAAHAANYYANAAALKERLAALDNSFRAGLASCTNRNIITSHAAFGYLATAYQLIQIPITGISPDSEPSPRQLGEIVRLAKEKHIKYIFFESLASPKLSETIAREVGARTLVLNPLEGLTPDEAARGEDYFSEMAKNLANLQVACE